jgi:hypothetical protein
MVLVLLPIILFMNSHWWLPYYQVGNLAFLIAALALSICVLQNRMPLLGPMLVSILVLVNMINFTSEYGKILRKDLKLKTTRALAVGDVIRRYTPEDSAIVVFGLTSLEGVIKPVTSYSPEIIYYSYRKGLTVESGWERKMSNDLFQYLGGNNPRAIIICKRNLNKFLRFIPKTDKNLPVEFYKVQKCYVWIPGVRSITLADGSKADRIVAPLEQAP